MKNYNLLEEIYSVLESYELSEKDIIWCGSEDFRTVWEQFKEVAKITDYSHKFELPSDLVIVANGWYLELLPDDTDDLFDVIETPRMPSIVRDVKYLSTTYSKYNEPYPNLLDLN